MASAAPTSTSINTHRPALAPAAPLSNNGHAHAPLHAAPHPPPAPKSGVTSTAPQPTAPQPATAAQPPAALDDDWPTLDELSLRYLHRVIEHAKGNKTKAAEVLGIDRRTVSRILSKASRQGKPPTMQTANRK